ncbi:MAG: 5-formyltetrahydrofolate cyclo-ligase [Crocinitomicaceae bacterium]|nr:5-formyltetrahydrofolate cyclo-ligase [Crocinitomicaceae bacterium]
MSDRRSEDGQTATISTDFRLPLGRKQFAVKIREDKIQLRVEMLRKREEMDAAKKSVADQKICSLLEEKIRFSGVKVIHTYLPMDAEINLFPLIEKLLIDEFTVICPKVLRQRKLENRVLRSFEELEEGIYGTRHPMGDSAYLGTIDFFIVPGLAFDLQGNRIGYGAGYYDVMLADFPSAHKCGVGYSFQLFNVIPAEPHDIKLDDVVIV